MNPLVSVLMTAFNREKYIDEAIESVINSTYQNWELIIVDDCSKDRTVEIAKSYEAKDHRIKVYINEMNLGDYPNRNKAASYAKGKYIKYIDADDMIYPFGLEIMVDNMEKFIDAGWGLMSMPQDNKQIYPFQLNPLEIYQRHFFYTPVFHKAPLSSIIKKEVFDRINGFKNVRHYGDMDLWQRLAMKYPLVLMQAGLVWWRSHNDQEAGKRKQKALLPIETTNVTIRNIKHKDCPLLGNERLIVLQKLRNYKINQIISACKRLEFNMGYKMIKYF